jgi:hypothetical protein
MRGAWVALIVCVLAGCGDDAPFGGSVEIVGHHDLGGRGMSSAIAIADDTIYVGSRIDDRSILILDVSDPSTPVQVGEIPGALGMSSRELRAVADLNLLVVLSLRCDPMLHGCSETGGRPEAIELFDITDRAAPVLTATYPIKGSTFFPRGPHEFYLRRDGERVLIFVAAPPASPSLEVIDATDKANPVKFAEWDPRDAGLPGDGGADDILHSVSVSIDGQRLFLSHQLSGLLVADASALPAITLMTPPANALDFSPPGTVGPHSAVEVPNRDLVVITEEVYPAPYGTGCPWGKLRIADVSDPTAPVLLSEFGVAENDPATCAQPNERVAFTAHNATATENLAFVTWYSAGLQIIDLEDPAAPRSLVDFRPEPLASVITEDPSLGAVPVEMWSYPVIKDGLVYVVDTRNGLYILRYHGLHAREVSEEDFLEGNSNL